MKPFALIFDLDGTLVNSVDFYKALFEELIERFGYEACCSEDFLRLNGLSRGRSLMKLVQEKKLQRRVLPYLFMKRRSLEKRLRQEMDLYPEVEACLNRFSAMPMAIATSANRRHASFCAKQFGLDRYFPVIVSKEKIKRPKPHPDIYLRAAQKLGVIPHQCLAIEDSPYGVLAAKRAGMNSIALLQTTPKRYFTGDYAPDLFIDSLDALDFELIEALLRS